MGSERNFRWMSSRGNAMTPVPADIMAAAEAIVMLSRARPKPKPKPEPEPTPMRLPYPWRVVVGMMQTPCRPGTY